MNPNEATSFKQLFQGMAPEGTTVVSGTVVKASPLSIRIENDDKLTVSGSVLLVPKYLTDWTAGVDISLGKGTINSITNNVLDHTHKLSTFSITGATMTVHNALEAGEAVYLLKFNNGKNYLVLDRVAS